MSLKFSVGDLTIHRIIEQETSFVPALEMIPGLTPELLAENRAWMRQAKALDDQDVLPGHVAVAMGRGKDDAVFSGDLMHSPLQTLYPELSIKFDVDPAKAATTRRSFLERYCDTDTLCCTAHFPSPSVGKIKRKGNAFMCAAV